MLRHASQRDSNFRGPDFLFFINVRAALHSRVWVRAIAVFDVEVYPVAIGAYFKFEIVAGVGGVRLEKDFDDIPVPQMVAAARGFGIRENGQYAIAGAIVKKERVRIPENANLCFKLGISIFALPIGIENDGLRSLPCGRRRKAIGS